MSLRVRLMICLNGLLLVTVVLVSGLTLFTTVQSLRERTKRDALGTASLLASAATMTLEAPREAQPAGRPDPRSAVKRLVQHAVDAGSLKAVFLADPKGQPVVCSSPSTGADLIKDYWQNLDVLAMTTIKTLEPAARFRDNSVEASVPLAGFGGQAGALICRLSTEELDEAIAASLRDIAVLSFAGLIAGALLSSVLAKRVSGPLRKLSEAASVIGAGGFKHRVKVESSDEVGRLADSFNRMADSLETYTAELARTAAEKEALRREMDIAAEIQRSLLPESCPQIEGFDTAAQSVPAREVGGDFYDFIPLPNDRWGVVIADVSGKGVPAALLMALSRSLIRSYSQDKPSILNALQLANNFMLRDTRSEMFVTCFYAVIDPDQRTLTYVNAGHNPPVVTRSEGQIVMLPASGTPLGITEETGIEEGTCQLASGDVVMMYTDGITEAQDGYGGQFGITRVEEIVKNANRLAAAEIIERMLTAVRTFAGSQPQFDDMTAVALKVH